MVSMTCIATQVIKIPTPTTGGYINLGDCLVILSGIILGPIYGGLSAAIGSALADLLSGYVAYAPITFLIKEAMAVIIGLLIKDVNKPKTFSLIISCCIAEVIMVLGYFSFEATLMGYGLGAAASIPGNTVQGIVGAFLAILLLPLIAKLNIPSYRQKENQK